MALVSNRPSGHPPPGMPDYDDLCDDYTYDDLTDSRDLDNLDLDDLTIPDVIKLPTMNGNVKKQNGISKINEKHAEYLNGKMLQQNGKLTNGTHTRNNIKSRNP